MLELRRRSIDRCGRLLEEAEPSLTALDEARDPQSSAERPRRGPAAGRCEPLLRERPGIVLLSEQQQGGGRLRLPGGHERGVAAADGLEAPTDGEHLVQPAAKVAAHQPKARPAVEEPVGVRRVRIVFEGAAGEDLGGLVELALLDQGVGEVPCR